MILRPTALAAPRTAAAPPHSNFINSIIAAMIKQESLSNNSDLLFHISTRWLVSQMNELRVCLTSSSGTKISTHSPLLALILSHNLTDDTSTTFLGNLRDFFPEWHGRSIFYVFWPLHFFVCTYQGTKNGYSLHRVVIRFETSYGVCKGQHVALALHRKH